MHTTDTKNNKGNIYGLDISIKSYSLVYIDDNGKVHIVSESNNTKLSLSSYLSELKDIARVIGDGIELDSIVYIDATQYRFKTRKKQQEQLHTLIGMVCGYVSDCSFYRIEPKEIRKYLDIHLTAKKEDVWSYIPEEYKSQLPDNVSEHTLDALCLCLWGKNCTSW